MSLEDETIHLIYCSSEKFSITTEDMQEILAEAIEYNGKHNITGMLLYKEGTFMQILEGKAETVRSLYKNKIMKDERHTNITLIVDAKIKAREFQEWSMAAKKIDGDTPQIEGVIDFNDKRFSDPMFQENPSLAHKVLLGFRSDEAYRVFPRA